MSFNFDEKIVFNLVKKYSNTKKNQLNDFDDLMSEAKIVALISVKKWCSDRNTKKSTFIFKCVKNHLEDLRKKESRRIDIKESIVDLDFESDDSSIETFELCSTMEKVLTKKEFEFFKLHWIEGYTESEIVSLGLLSRSQARTIHKNILAKFEKEVA